MAKTPNPIERGYPYYTLASCLKLGEAVSAAGGRDVPKGIVAHELGVDEGASSFASLCSSAKTFGIVDGLRGLSLTEDGHNFFLPTSPEDKRAALLSFVESPPTFRFLIERFDGRQIPPAKMLANILRRENGVPQSWCARAAGLFISSVEEIGAKDAGGHLRFGVARHRLRSDERPTGSFVNDSGHSLEATGISDKATTTVPLSGAGKYEFVAASNHWVFSEAGGTVKLETPDPLPRALWERLKRYVDMLEPGETE